MGFKCTSFRDCTFENQTYKINAKYGEGEIPHEAKTGSGPLLLSFSFFADEQSIHKVYSNTYRIQIKY